jgi:RNA polymerase sigma-70 factor (ECF subfamily)
MNPPSPSPDSRRTSEFVRLYAAHSRRVYTYLLTLVPNRADVEEVFQDVSAVLWEKFDEFVPDTNFAAWACKIAQFKARKLVERSSRRSALFNGDLIEKLDLEMQHVDDSLDAEYAALAACFAQLPEFDRNLIERRYRKSGNPQSLADDLNLPVSKVYKMLARIRHSLLVCITSRLAEGDRP